MSNFPKVRISMPSYRLSWDDNPYAVIKTKHPSLTGSFGTRQPSGITGICAEAHQKSIGVEAGHAPTNDRLGIDKKCRQRAGRLYDSALIADTSAALPRVLPPQ